MSSDQTRIFTKDNLDTYLKELAKEFRRLNGTAMPGEIVLIGGAAVLANYGFRDMTADIDAVVHASSSLKEAINRIGDKYDLPRGWLNMDFMQTASYSPKLDEFSVYYKTFSNVLQVRTISAEYLIAMKLRSGRKYKSDLSDIIGILAEHERQGNPMTLKMINTAVCSLYGGWEDFPEDSRPFIENAIANGDYGKVYSSVKEEELASKNMLLAFEKEYPKVIRESNMDEILKGLKDRQWNQSKRGKEK